MGAGAARADLLELYSVGSGAIGLALLVGLMVWLFERRHNEEFGGGVAKGLSTSVWWTTVAMTQRAIGQAGPRTMPGRFVAMLWMVGSIIAIAVFTAGITSALTVRQLQGNVQGVTDLSQVQSRRRRRLLDRGSARHASGPPSRLFRTPRTGCRRCAPAGSTPSSMTAR